LNLHNKIKVLDEPNCSVHWGNERRNGQIYSCGVGEEASGEWRGKRGEVGQGWGVVSQGGAR